MDIKVSIIIPTYNEENYIDECLSSILEEIKNSDTSNEQYEIIVVSDGASDEVVNKVTKYETLFANFKLLKMDHKGAGAARNFGLNAARGEYVAFVDADDRLSKGFLKVCNELLEKKKDLYIFGLKRIEDDKIELWTVADKEYDTVHKFADEYIKHGHMLIYSNCNKLYKTKIIRDNNIQFDGEIHFGEDRLFNYEYLRHCNNVLTSSKIKHDYIKRNAISQSTKHYEKYFDIALRLHKEKMKCFLELSENVSEDEIKTFVAEDLIKEIEKALARFDMHKDEEEENVQLINKIVFEEQDEMSDDIGTMIILGSSNCGYKVERAIDLCKGKSYMNYIVSGGNLHMSGDVTEAEYMAKVLEGDDIEKSKIHIENKAKNTLENFEYSFEILDNILKENDVKTRCKYGVLTSGFHLKRAKLLLSRYYKERYSSARFFSAFGSTVTLSAWCKSENGKKIVYHEINKNIKNDFDIYKNFIYS